jgi:hypothetical protein
MNFNEISKDFSDVSEMCELKRTLQVTIKDTIYRVEVFYCHSNPNAEWTASIYSSYDGSYWTQLEEFPWIGEREEETAIRLSLNFLTERAT